MVARPRFLALATFVAALPLKHIVDLPPPILWAAQFPVWVNEVRQAGAAECWFGEILERLRQRGLEATR